MYLCMLTFVFPLNFLVLRTIVDLINPSFSDAFNPLATEPDGTDEGDPDLETLVIWISGRTG